MKKELLLDIINEEITFCILEKKEKKKKKKKKSTKKSKKKKKSKSKTQSEKALRKNGNKLSASDEAHIRHDVNNSDLINVAALARLVYPDHTPEGGQSQLRKKLKGIKNDSGSEYHLQQGEAKTIRRALNKI